GGGRGHVSIMLPGPLPRRHFPEPAPDRPLCPIPSSHVNSYSQGSTSIKAVSVTLVLALIIGGVLWAWTVNRPKEEASAENSGSSDSSLQATLVGAGNEIGLSVAFKEEQAEIAQGLVDDYVSGSSSDSLSPSAQAIAAGGYPTDLVTHIDLKRTGESEVTVHDIRPVSIQRGDPASHTLLTTGGSNSPQTETMHFLMDEPEPVAREGIPPVPTDSENGNRYFDYQTIRVGDGQKVVLGFHAYWSSFDFQIEVAYEVDGDYATELVTDPDGNVHTFRLSAHVCPPEAPNPWGFDELDTDEPPHYENVWVQGMQSRTMRNPDPESFCEERIY
ncbi:hypothetical protein, partial [Nocardiopsis rhodophaea]